MDAVLDLRVEPGEAAASADERLLAGALEAAYAAQLDAVLHGSAADVVAARQATESLEQLLLERRAVGEMPRLAMGRDPSYYLG
jgi:hypothetical protein